MAISETLPLLNLALAVGSGQQQQEQREQEDAGKEQHHQRRRRSSSLSQPSQPSHPSQRRKSNGRRRSSSFSKRKYASSNSLRSLPLLPVIHEDGLSSMDASPGSSSNSRGGHTLPARRSSSFTSGSSSSSSGRYENYNSKSHQIIWPPEHKHNATWPPGSNQSNDKRQQQQPHQQQPQAPVNNYGSIYIHHVDPELGYISSSPSDSSSGTLNYDSDYTRYHSSRRYRSLRLLFTTLLAILLSSAVWLPLLQKDDDDDEASTSSVAGGQYSSNSSASYFRTHHKFYDEMNDPFSRDIGDSSTSSSKNVDSNWYRHSDKWSSRISRVSVVVNDGIVGPKEEDGTMSRDVDYGVVNESRSIPTSVSFADLAKMMLPPYFQQTIDLCLSTIIPEMTTIVITNETSLLLDDADVTQEEAMGNRTVGSDEVVMTTTSVMPSEVYILRKTILKTRDLFDIFSPMYSKHSSVEDYLQKDEIPSKNNAENTEETPGHISLDNNDEASSETKDLWKTLRGLLNNGYMLLGDFQDLDHAKISYTSEQLAQYQEKIWIWHDGFMLFVEEHEQLIRSYLSLPCKKKKNRHQQQQQSMNTKNNDEQCRHIHSHSSHLFWGNVTRDELPNGNSEKATSALWRLGRSQLERAGVYLNEALTYEHVTTSTAIPGNDASIDDDDADGEDDGAHAMYHNLRKELRSFVDEVDLFGNLLLRDSSLIPEIEKKKANEEVVDLNRTPISDLEKHTDQALKSIKGARKLLGDLNDDYVAHSTYVEWDKYPEEQLRLEKDVATQWNYFRNWAQDVDLFADIQFLRDRMDPEADLREETVQDHSLGELYGSANPTYSLQSFLIERKANPTNHFVVGNDAGDADSIISAISLAYIESMHSGQQLTPIVSISKDCFTHDRPAVSLLFQLAGIDDPLANLLFIDDLTDMLRNDIKESSSSRSITLVDQNTLNPSLKHFRENLIVTDIFDHHKDAKQFKETCDGDHRNIAFDGGHPLVASTTTLVAERLRDYPHLYSPAIGMLLLGVILLDSVNLDEAVGKVTQRDGDAAADLMFQTDWSAAVSSSYLTHEDNGHITIDKDDLFEKLQHSKYDPKFWSSLSAERALQLDYKEFHFHGTNQTHTSKKQGHRLGRHKKKFGISSILVPGLDFMTRERFYSSTLAFMESRQISFLGIMFAFYDGQGTLRRQLAFVSIERTVSLHELMCSFLKSPAYKSVDLQLEKIQLPEGLGAGDIFSSKGAFWRKNVILFDQNNLSPSRKQIGPMLEDYFAELK